VFERGNEGAVPSSASRSTSRIATGIENSYPVVAGPDGRDRRVDEMSKCGHYQHWQEDFQLVQEMGLEYLRYGPPY
jgi:beta-glucosidase/6-phospho-beta-glucosidase/beta-galactosidase